MQRLIAKLTTVCITATLLSASPAQASHDSPLSIAASDYREAVRHFERMVIRSRYLHRQHERAADDLEDATSRLVRAARYEQNSDQLFHVWQKIQYLQHRAEAVIFADPNCPSAIELADCWQHVQLAHDHVAHELAGCGWFPNHHHSAVYQPSIYPSPIILPSPSLPASNHPSQWNPNRGQPVTSYWIQNPGVDFRSYIRTGNKPPVIYRTPSRPKIDTIQVGANLQRFGR